MTNDLSDRTMEELYECWERELAQVVRDVDVTVVAALEVEAERRGVILPRVLRAMTAAFDESLHPRGKDGQFISIGGLIKLVGYSVMGKDGKMKSFDGRRAKVMAINKDPKDKEHPNIRVGILDAAGKPSVILNDVKPNQVLQAPEKGRLDTTPSAPNAPASKAAQNLNDAISKDIGGKMTRVLEADPGAFKGQSPNLYDANVALGFVKGRENMKYVDLADPGGGYRDSNGYGTWENDKTGSWAWTPGNSDTPTIRVNKDGSVDIDQAAVDEYAAIGDDATKKSWADENLFDENNIIPQGSPNGVDMGGDMSSGPEYQQTGVTTGMVDDKTIDFFAENNGVDADLARNSTQYQTMLDYANRGVVPTQDELSSMDGTTRTGLSIWFDIGGENPSYGGPDDNYANSKEHAVQYMNNTAKPDAPAGELDNGPDMSGGPEYQQTGVDVPEIDQPLPEQPMITDEEGVNWYLDEADVGGTGPTVTLWNDESESKTMKRSEFEAAGPIAPEDAGVPDEYNVPDDNAYPEEWNAEDIASYEGWASDQSSKGLPDSVEDYEADDVGTVMSLDDVTYDAMTGEYMSAYTGDPLTEGEMDSLGLDTRFAPPDGVNVINRGVPSPDAAPGGGGTMEQGFRMQQQSAIDDFTKEFGASPSFHSGNDVGDAYANFEAGLADYRDTMTMGRVDEVNASKAELVDLYYGVQDAEGFNELDDATRDDWTQAFEVGIFEGDLNDYAGPQAVIPELNIPDIPDVPRPEGMGGGVGDSYDAQIAEVDAIPDLTPAIRTMMERAALSTSIKNATDALPPLEPNDMSNPNVVQRANLSLVKWDGDYKSQLAEIRSKADDPELLSIIDEAEDIADSWGGGEGGETTPDAGVPDTAAPSVGAPSAANGWKNTYKKGDEVPISHLPPGAKVDSSAYGGKFGGYNVGTPILVDGGDPNDPDDYRFRVRDGAGQWDWVQGETKFTVNSPENGKKLNPRGQKYLELGGGGGGGTAAPSAAPDDTNIPEPEPQAAPEAQVTGPESGFEGSAVKLLDGGDATPGSKVTSVKDGKTYTIEGVYNNPKLGKDTYVRLRDEDGKLSYKSKRTLKSEGGGGGASVQDFTQGGEGAAPAANPSQPAPAGLDKRSDPQYKTDYEKGWKYSSSKNANLDYADSKGLSSNDAWMDGYMDMAKGDPKWTSATKTEDSAPAPAGLPDNWNPKDKSAIDKAKSPKFIESIAAESPKMTDEKYDSFSNEWENAGLYDGADDTSKLDVAKQIAAKYLNTPDPTPDELKPAGPLKVTNLKNSDSSKLRSAGFKQGDRVRIDGNFKSGKSLEGQIIGSRSQSYPIRNFDEGMMGTELVLKLDDGRDVRVKIRQLNSIEQLPKAPDKPQPKPAPNPKPTPKSMNDPDILKLIQQTDAGLYENAQEYDNPQYTAVQLLDTRRDQVGSEIAYALENHKNHIVLKVPSGSEEGIPLDLAVAWAAANGVSIPASSGF